MSTAFVTLHVGEGTFAPIRVDDWPSIHALGAHECPPQTAAAVNAAREALRPGGGVGTTSVLDAGDLRRRARRGDAGSGSTILFNNPPYRYRRDKPQSPTFTCPAALCSPGVREVAGRDMFLRAYDEAIAHATASSATRREADSLKRSFGFWALFEDSPCFRSVSHLCARVLRLLAAAGVRRFRRGCLKKLHGSGNRQRRSSSKRRQRPVVLL